MTSYLSILPREVLDLIYFLVYKQELYEVNTSIKRDVIYILKNNSSSIKVTHYRYNNITYIFEYDLQQKQMWLPWGIPALDGGYLLKIKSYFTNTNYPNCKFKETFKYFS